MRTSDVRAVRFRITVSVGESVRIVRALQEMTQSELATDWDSSIHHLAIENSSVNLGVERAKVLARALRCHPAVLVFPGWDIHKITLTKISMLARYTSSAVTATANGTPSVSKCFFPQRTLSASVVRSFRKSFVPLVSLTR